MVANIGEFFTSDIAAPTAPVSSVLIADGAVAAFNPDEDTRSR
jgi:enamidase